MKKSIATALETALYTIDLPRRIADKTLKFGYDVLAEVIENCTGKDRFTLAKYAAQGSAVALVAGVYNSPLIRRHSPEFLFYSPLGALMVYTMSFSAGDFRDYYLKSEDTLEEEPEFLLLIYRAIRLPIVASSYLPISAGINSIGQDLSNGLGAICVGTGCLLWGSFYYWIDGDHSLWEKTKQGFRRTYQMVRNIASTKQPVPYPQPTCIPEPSVE